MGMWKLKSPDNNLQININQQEDGSIAYCVLKQGKTVIEKSALGICTDLGDFIENLCFEKEERNSIREEYSIPVGKKDVYKNWCEELALHFKACDSKFTVRFRAFDNAAAFRYEIEHPEKKEFLVKRERTEFQIPSGCDRFWLQDWNKAYEGPYTAREWNKSLNGQPYGMPSLFFSEKDSVWIMLNEANVINTNGRFCSCHLIGDENGCMTIGFAPEEKGNPIKTWLPFQSAWRYAVAADNLDDLVNSTVNYNLNPPSVIEDTSWIKPGRSLWAWWEDMNGAQLYLESRNYVDMAAAYGFEALTLDCGWDANWLKDLCEYAHKKGVQIWIWTDMKRVDTVEKAEKLIPLWAGWGVDGLKIDFFENDSQHTMWQYNMLAELMKEYKLMINFHGSVKPMGEGRTWPHFMTAEGIMGMEHYQWSDMPDAIHNCTVPFTRNVAGPMDYTPTAFSNLENKNTTMAHQMALPVVFDSGITNYALALRYMEGWKGTDFLRRTKNHYKGVKVLSGYPGDHAAILRYTDDEWLIGIITAPKKVVNIPLGFLGEGEYEAEIYEDAEKGEMIAVNRKVVTADDTLRFSLLEGGGAGVYITRKIGPLSSGICSGYMSDNYVEYMGEDARMLHGSEPVEWDEQTRGFLLNGAAEFEGSVKRSGNYSLRFFYAAGEEWTLELECGAFSEVKTMPGSTSMRTFVTQEMIVPIEEGEFTIRMKRASGSAPAVWKLKLIDNHPSVPVSYIPFEENLRGGGEIAAVGGVPAAVGLGNGASLEFNEVTVPKAGRYILRINYTGGESRDISIQINDGEIIDTYLHCTSGWGFPNWLNDCDKEVLVHLKAGKNKIRLYNDHGRMSHIRRIDLIEE